MSQTPPHSAEMEKTVIGCLLLDGDAFELIKNTITEESFYTQNNREIFSAMKALDDELVPIDTASVSEKLKSKGKLFDIGGQPYLFQLISECPSSANIEHYAKIVAEKKTRRDFLSLSGQVATVVSKNGQSTQEMLDGLKESIQKIESNSVTKKINPVKENVGKVNTTIDEKLKGDKTFRSIPTGIRAIDTYITGWKPGNFHVIGARGGTGKTSLVWNSLRHSAEMGIPAALISCEMPEIQLLNKAVSAITGIPLSLIDDYPERLTDRDRERINTALAHLKKLPLYIEASKDAHLSGNIIKSINHLVREKGVKLIAIDHISRFKNSSAEGKFQKKFEFHTEFSHQLDKLAEELKFAIILLSQLNPPRNRTNPRPMSTDMRESQAYYEDCDVMMLMHRPEQTYLQENKKATEVPQAIKGRTEIYFAKNRGGEEGMVHLHFEGAQSRFREIEKQEAEPPRQYGRDDEDEKPF